MQENTRSLEVARHGSFRMVLAISLLLVNSQTSAKEVLLTTQQPYSLDNNTTLMIEDAISPQGAIWLKLCSGNETIDSAMIRLGGYLKYGNKNITFDKIYSGGESDLIALKIEYEGSKSSEADDSASSSNLTNNADSNKVPFASSFLTYDSNATSNISIFSNNLSTG